MKNKTIMGMLLIVGILFSSVAFAETIPCVPSWTYITSGCINTWQTTTWNDGCGHTITQTYPCMNSTNVKYTFSSYEQLNNVLKKLPTTLTLQEFNKKMYYACYMRTTPLNIISTRYSSDISNPSDVQMSCDYVAFPTSPVCKIPGQTCSQYSSTFWKFGNNPYAWKYCSLNWNNKEIKCSSLSNYGQYFESANTKFSIIV